MSQDDQEIIVQARRRASVSAQYGSREAKSGTFGELQHVKAYSARVLRDAQAAYEPWAQWEAIIKLLESEESREALKDYKAFSDMRISYYKESLLAVARVTDPVQSSRQQIQSAPVEDLQYSLLGLAKVLDDADLRQRLSSKQWALDLGYPTFLAEGAAVENANRIGEFRALIPTNWQIGPSDPRLINLRETLKPLRDNILAHSIGDPRALGQFTVDEVRQFLKLSLALATNMQLVFTGSAVSASDWMEFCLEHANKFWPIAFQGFVERHRRHQAEREQLRREAGLQS